MQSVAQLRKWLAWSAVALLAITTVSYYVARMKVVPKLHVKPQDLGLDIQQTSSGFTLSKSEGVGLPDAAACAPASLTIDAAMRSGPGPLARLHRTPPGGTTRAAGAGLLVCSSPPLARRS